MTKNLSKQIYSELITGKYINKNKLDEKTSVELDNTLFIEIEKYFNEYEELFSNIGYTLNMENEYFYLSKEEVIDLEDEKSIDKTLLKEYILMNCIIRYLMDNKIDLSRTILNKDIGISLDDLNKMFNDDKFSVLLETVEITKNSKAILDVLVKRNIMERNKLSNLCLTNIGKEFLKFVQLEGAELFEKK